MNKAVIDEIISSYEKDQYAMYLRKSRADLELEAMNHEETLARHRNILNDLASRMNITPDQITVYHEIVSGESIQDRPEMQRLLHGVYQKKYKGVLVVEVERLARGNTKDQGEVADAFQYSDTKIITPSKVYDPNNEFDQEYFEFGLFMSRREYKTIRRRLEAGKLQAVLEGNYLLPQRILGYNILKKSKKERYLVINEDEVKYVHMIFDWYTEERLTTFAIAKRLTHMGVPTMKGAFEWSRETVRDMLKNKHYIGLIEWGRMKTVKQIDPKTGLFKKMRVKASDEEITIAKGKHERIISDEQFEKAQKLMKDANNTPINYSANFVNPIAGLVKCAHCGTAMVYFDAKRGRTIRLTHKGRFTCKVKSLPFTEVLDALVESLKMYIEDFEIKIENDHNSDAVVSHQDMIKAMEAELSNQNNRKNRLMTSWEANDGTYTREEFVERKMMYANVISELKSRIEEAKKNAPKQINYEEKIVSLHKVIDCIKNPDIDAKSKNEFLKEYIEVIKYDAIDYGRTKGGKPILDVHLK